MFYFFWYTANLSYIESYRVRPQFKKPSSSEDSSWGADIFLGGGER